ncbi:hypothetical protein, partial [Schinkia azotoformans]|uniref:hypothetical protein n=1 Tax=Schinkia azotoformans TaxID=1454 RepID=UPI003D298E73
ISGKPAKRESLNMCEDHFIHSHKKCNHGKSGTRAPCPQKRKMRPCQEQNPHSLSAKMKNATMPKAEPPLPVRNVRKP